MLTTSDPKDSYTILEIRQHFMPINTREAQISSGTLGHSLQTPDDVSFIILFHNSSPR
jgi:hypothetical protein